uniref:RNMT-activating mini protein n=1 Tax=Electrophorus electricus TaxID=8005 RepID=A0A4W4GQ73_ELEEL
MTECTETSPNYESQFAHRFTEEDEAFQQYVLRPQSQPPVVEAWRPRGGGFQRGRDNRLSIYICDYYGFVIGIWYRMNNWHIHALHSCICCY